MSSKETGIGGKDSFIKVNGDPHPGWNTTLVTDNDVVGERAHSLASGSLACANLLRSYAKHPRPGVSVVAVMISGISPKVD